MYLYSIVRIGTNVVWPKKIPLLCSDYTSGPVHLAKIGKIPRAVHSLVGPGFQLGKQQEKQVELLYLWNKFKRSKQKEILNYDI